MENKYMLGLIALAIVAILGVSMISAFGFGKWSDITEEEKAEILEQKKEIMIAIENQDYEAWKSLMESQLTKEDFNTLVEKYSKMSEFKLAMQEAKESGDFSKWEGHKEGFGFKGKHFNKDYSGEGHFGKCGK